MVGTIPRLKKMNEMGEEAGWALELFRRILERDNDPGSGCGRVSNKLRVGTLWFSTCPRGVCNGLGSNFSFL